MIDAETLKRLQRLRHARDIADGDTGRPSPDRLKSRGIDLTVALGRLARDADGLDRPAVIEAALMAAIGGANLFRIDLSKLALPPVDASDPLRSLADPAGRFADACEKVDHLEEFAVIGRAAVIDAVAWCASAADVRVLDVPDAPARILVQPLLAQPRDGDSALTAAVA